MMFCYKLNVHHCLKNTQSTRSSLSACKVYGSHKFKCGFKPHSWELLQLTLLFVSKEMLFFYDRVTFKGRSPRHSMQKCPSCVFIHRYFLALSWCGRGKNKEEVLTFQIDPASCQLDVRLRSLPHHHQMKKTPTYGHQLQRHTGNF